MTNREWFKDAKFGMMIHWGLYSLPAGEWKGRRMSDIGEWCQQYFRIPNAEYHRLAGSFNPICFDAEEWVKLAVEAGYDLHGFTSKHHEGFANVQSEISPFNICDARPFTATSWGSLPKPAISTDSSSAVLFAGPRLERTERRRLYRRQDLVRGKGLLDEQLGLSGR